MPSYGARNDPRRDDEKDIREPFDIYLRNEGYFVRKAGNGLEALELLQKETVDLLIRDVMLPRMDDIQACLKIRERLEDIPDNGRSLFRTSVLIFL